MSQSRDELFLKLALRQGLFSQQEAREFLIRYRTEGARGEGIGHWLVVEGVVTEEQAAQIRGAIAHRAEGHVDNTRRRVPKRAGGGAKPSGGHAHQPVRHHRPVNQGVSVTPTQQALYIATGVLTIGLIMFLVFQFQKDPVTYTDIADENAKKNEERKEESAEEIANRMLDADVTPVTAQINAPQWTPEEIERMKKGIESAITHARSRQSDGRIGKGIETIRKSLAEFGDVVPTEVQQLADAEIKEMQAILDQAYAEFLVTLGKQRAKGDDEGAEETILEIADVCGEEYAEKARKK